MPAPRREFEAAAGLVRIYDDADDAGRAAADLIAAALRRADEERDRAVLGLATGGTPVPVYRRLVDLYRAEALSFARASTYNLDEYYPIGPLDPKSYRAYMHQHLFAHVDLAPNRAHVLDGTVPEAFAVEHCATYDRWIAADGGLDLQLLGIGRNGHIGFNEPSDLPVDEALRLPTRPAELHPTTRHDAARDFGGDPAQVPGRALTVGVATILAARSIVLLAFGPNKADAVARAHRGPMTAELPASLLQSARDRTVWLLDEAAATGL